MNKIVPIVSINGDGVYGKYGKDGNFKRSNGNILSKKKRFPNRKAENRK